VALVLYELDDHVVTITLNRPEAHNAFGRDLLRELRDAFARFQGDFDAWVGVVTGAGGKAFSAGADLKEMSARRNRPPDEIAPEAPRPSGFARLLSRDSSDLFAGTTMWKPLVAGIDGYCLAGGLELALSCDIRIASPQSKFGLTEVTRGIIAGGGGTQRLTRAIPMAVAMDLLLTGRHMDAEEALRHGLVNQVVPSDQVMSTAQGIAARIAANAPLAVRATKEAALRGLGMPIDDGLRLEAHLSHMVGQTEDAREGPKAFAEKRAPRWQGR
jgi:enoyl-CoA hydratase/carnithine racemase